MEVPPAPPAPPAAPSGNDRNSPADLRAAEGSPSQDRSPQQPGSQRAFPDRRRERLQFSCNNCRRRKVRCDRQHPCYTCLSRGLGLTCTYTPEPPNTAAPRGITVHDRIQLLEGLVVSLMQQHAPQQAASAAPTVQNPASKSPVGSAEGETSPVRQIEAAPTVATSSPEGVDESFPPGDRQCPPSREDDLDLAPSEHGSMRMHPHGANYVDSAHWTAVLDSISQLKDHWEKEEEEKMAEPDEYELRDSPGPRLLYEPVQATKTEILASIPARPVVDRLVSRYFDAVGITPAVLHSGQFLREYERFWEDPRATPILWVALLFSIMCLATHIGQLSLTSTPDQDIGNRVYILRERTVQCLVLGHYTRGGAHVMEALINYCATELLLCKDADIGLWILSGTVVRLSLSMGYHRDPRNFSAISPFDGEMRRRVWTTVVQLDLRISGQMGLPRIIKPEHCDVAEPRNLLDSDFDENTAELPPSRPETEATPLLYGLAKNRIDAISGLIIDTISDTRPCSYSKIMELDKKLREAQTSLPPILQWEPLGRSIAVPPRIVMHRVWLQLGVQRLTVCLHRKYLALSLAQERYKYSRDCCLEASMKILEYQQLIDEETQPDGQLYFVRWMMSSVVQNNFLLAMSVLCYYIQLVSVRPQALLDPETLAKIRRLLRSSYEIWLRASPTSQEARKAVDYLSIILGQQGTERSLDRQDTVDYPSQDVNPVDQPPWDAYQDFSVPYGMDLMAIDLPATTSYGASTEHDRPSASTGTLDPFNTRDFLVWGP
ncbi:Nonribosomal peptide synthetase 14 [Pleurostoma richardsiae]|uniref:Nonribosomal peptide synthetase 14 n=1 Tax=Pleurostoma richardsiae TaxID=41990 RepID=A0AA38S4U5_9PEZI|nr:Nonribosomal peptide synthetase 14 [Pleurostoma richardsiae]